jgi:hypothetical protein
VFEFDNGDSSDSSRDWSSPPRPSLAQLVAPTQLTLARRGEEDWTLQVRPVPGIAVLEQWRRQAFGKNFTSVVLRLAAQPAQTAPAPRFDLAAPLVRCAVFPPRKSLINEFGEGGDEDRIIVLIDGPVEDSDLRAIAAAAVNGQSPLDVEIRAEAVLHVRPGRFLTLDCRREDIALSLAAELLRQHLAVLRRQPARAFTAPELWQVQRLLGVTGTLSIQPIETEVFSTAIDVGISTAPLSEPRPADRSLIYDIFSRTWHDEP